jgi:hypothetical protein
VEADMAVKKIPTDIKVYVDTADAKLKVKFEKDLQKGLGVLEKRLADVIHALDKRLTNEIKMLERRLTDKIETLDKKLSREIETLDKREAEDIERVNKRLTAFEGEIRQELATQIEIVRGEIAQLVIPQIAAGKFSGKGTIADILGARVAVVSIPRPSSEVDTAVISAGETAQFPPWGEKTLATVWLHPDGRLETKGNVANTTVSYVLIK